MIKKFSIAFCIVALVLAAISTASAVILFEDDFDDGVLDSNKWTLGVVTGGASYPPGSVGCCVTEADGILRIVQGQTDWGGKVISTGFTANPTELITIKKRLKVHYVNQYYTGASGLRSPDPETFVRVGYFNYNYNNDFWYGFGWPRYGLLPPIWDEWFEEEIIYNPVTGETAYSVTSGTTSNTINLLFNLLSETTTFKLDFSSYGWWTGHYMEIDYVTVEQNDATNDGLPAITVNGSAIPTSVPEPGGTIQYTIQVTNNSVSSDPVTLTSLTDTQYGNLVDVANQMISNSTCALETIQPGDTYSCTFIAEALGNVGDTITSTVNAIGTDDEGQEALATSNDVTVAIEDVRSYLTVTKSTSTPSLPEPGGPEDSFREGLPRSAVRPDTHEADWRRAGRCRSGLEGRLARVGEPRSPTRWRRGPRSSGFRRQRCRFGGRRSLQLGSEARPSRQAPSRKALGTLRECGLSTFDHRHQVESSSNSYNLQP